MKFSKISTIAIFHIPVSLLTFDTLAVQYLLYLSKLTFIFVAMELIEVYF